MSDNSTEAPLPPGIARVLERFKGMGREEKMQTLLAYAKKLEPLPARFAGLDRAAFTVPECQTRVDLFPEMREGRLWFFVDMNARQSPTIAAFLSLLLGAVNGEPAAAVLAIPEDFVPRVMAGIGLAARETGLSAMVHRMKRHAREARGA